MFKERQTTGITERLTERHRETEGVRETEENNNIIQWKPLNVVTLVRQESDNINRMITITKCSIH